MYICKLRSHPGGGVVESAARWSWYESKIANDATPMAPYAARRLASSKEVVDICECGHHRSLRLTVASASAAAQLCVAADKGLAYARSLQLNAKSLGTHVTPMTIDPLGKLGGFQKLLRAEEQLRDIVDPPGMRKIREMIEGSKLYSSAVEDLLGASLKTVLTQRKDLDALGIGSLREAFPTTAADLVERSAIRAAAPKAIKDVVESVGSLGAALRAAKGYASALEASGSLAGIDDVTRSVHLLDVGAGVLETLFRGAGLARDAEALSLGSNGIQKLVADPYRKRLSATSFEVIQLGAQAVDMALVDEAVDVIAEVPGELFRALDADLAWSDARELEDESAAQNEREQLSARVSDELTALLRDVDSDLPSLLSGARTAASSTNPDRIRHVCVSLRELLGHVLRRLAPDDAIRAWSEDPAHFHEGRPTRKARLLFLYGAIDSHSLRQFVEADVRAAIELVDFLNSATHVVSSELSSTALAVLIARVEGALLFIAKVGRARRGGA
jgi:hypothetical protein